MAISACTSIGSPSRVPVPCASTASTSAGPSPATASARRITRSWAGPLGAVSPLEAPLWLTALPRTTASTVRPCRRASDSRSSSTTPTPSPHPVPSAPSPNALHRPSADSTCLREKSTNASGEASTATPATAARSHSPARSAWAAWCSATSDDEHAVSTVIAGPCQPSAYASRPDSRLAALPVMK